jgi:hypothetical protein
MSQLELQRTLKMQSSSSSLRQLVLAVGLVAAAAIMPALAQSTDSVGPTTATASKPTRLTLDETRIGASAPVRLDQSMGPVWVEFEGSSSLTERLREAVGRQHIELAATKTEARSLLIVAGDIELRGGPVHHRGTRLKLKDGDASASTAGVSGAQAWQLGVNALGAVAFPSAWSVADLLASLGHAAGVGGWFNKAVSGDPRGICFGKSCETWNLVRQTVTLKGKLVAPGTSDVFVGAVAAAQSEVVDPDHLVAMASLAMLQSLGDQEALSFFERHGRSARPVAQALAQK